MYQSLIRDSENCRFQHHKWWWSRQIIVELVFSIGGVNVPDAVQQQKWWISAF